MNPTTAIKSAWAVLPANVKLFIHGLGSAAGGGAAVAATIYFSSPANLTLAGLKGSWAVILAGAIVAVAAYLKSSPIPGWKWGRAVETGESVERRAAPVILPPQVIVLPETPPGDPVP